MSRVLNGIVAICPDRGIGRDGTLPWHPTRLTHNLSGAKQTWEQVKSEYKTYFKVRSSYHLPQRHKIFSEWAGHFPRELMGKQNVVIMGRKTWFSIPGKNRPLNNRINIVLSKELKAAPAGAHHLAADFASALKLVDTELSDQADQVWVIGGSSLYKELMEHPGTKRLFVTQILMQFQCDTFLPEISPEKFHLLPQYPGVPQELQEENGIQYRFEVYESTEP